MKGNDRERQRRRVENKLINAIDAGATGDRILHNGSLRVPILDLLIYRAAMIGLPAIRSLSHALPGGR